MNTNRNLYVYIILSKMCNLRHTFCFQRDFSTVQLSNDLIYKKLLPVYEKAKVLRVHGGEITIIPGAYEYIEFLACHYPDMIINIVTNVVKYDGKWLGLIEKYNNVVLNLSVNCTKQDITRSILKNKADNVHE